MAISFESTSPASALRKESPGSTVSSPSQTVSPSSDKRFWSTLRSRVEMLLENRKPVDPSVPAQSSAESVKGVSRLKEDSMLLLRGFDSVAQSLYQLSNNLENALQGARDLARAPTVSEIVQATLQKAQNEEENQAKDRSKDEQADNEVDKRGLKRKLDSDECCDDTGDEDSHKAGEKCPHGLKKIQRAKNIALSMASKAATMARELRSIKSDLVFMQERCAMLEDENRKLRDPSVQNDEDDLVRLQLEALLAEKSRLANENETLKRENLNLHQLVEYHQVTSQDLSASYENLIRDIGLDFSSPLEEAVNEGEDDDDDRPFKTPHTDLSGFCKSLDECFQRLEQEQEQEQDNN